MTRQPGPAVLELCKDSHDEVRAAAIRALGSLGDKEDVSQLVTLLAEEKSQKDAVDALTHLHGDGVNAAICGQLKNAAAPVHVSLLKLLVARHAIDSVPAVLEASKDSDAAVRAAALEALGQLAGPELIAKLAREIIDAKDSASREEAEKSLAVIARRDPKNTNPALPLLQAMLHLSDSEKMALLPALGRIGGAAARKVVEADLSDDVPAHRAAAIHALCNWPDGSVDVRLVQLATDASDPTRRKTLVDALIRIAPLPDKRSDAQRLKMVEKAMDLAGSDAQRAAVIKRARAIRSVETFRFIAPYMDQPQFSQIACETVVEIAHHKVLRQPNKAEFAKALDKVIALSKDPEALLRAKHYLKDETWVEKQLKGK